LFYYHEITSAQLPTGLLCSVRAPMGTDELYHVPSWSIIQTPTLGKWIALFATCFMLVSCLTHSLIHKIEGTYSSKISLTFRGLHSIICQLIELFVNVTVQCNVYLSLGVSPNLSWKLLPWIKTLLEYWQLSTIGTSFIHLLISLTCTIKFLQKAYA
jgi:hypothetical protein